MKNLNNWTELEKIKSQLERADIQKKSLIRNIYKEYESYLKLVRDLIFSSVENTIYRFCSEFLINNKIINTKELGNLLENKITYLINSRLPFITIEQLIINDSINTENLRLEFNGSRELSE